MATDMVESGFNGFFDVLKGAAIAGFKAFARTLVPGSIDNSAIPVLNYKTDGLVASLVPIA